MWRDGGEPRGGRAGAGSRGAHLAAAFSLGISGTLGVRWVFEESGPDESAVLRIVMTRQG
jgi:hypothetical protein